MAKISLGTGTIITGNEKKWSPLQEVIFSAIENTEDNLLIQARAGSGKTTTLIECAKRMPRNKRILFAAFNKAIVSELSNRLPVTVDCRTLHSIGFELCKRGLGKFTVSNTWKTSNILAKYLDLTQQDEKDFYYSYRNTFASIVGLCKAYNMQEPIGRVQLANMFEELEADDMPIYFFNIFRQCEKEFFSPLENGKRYEIDFDDMLYLAVNDTEILPQYDCIFIDEAQDLSSIQRELLKRLLVPGGRIIVAGDEYQAIYGFRGANYNSLDLFRSHFNCVELPLSISYRCPSTVIQEARNFVPDIESFSGTGSVTTVNKETMVKLIQPGDMILCRYNAPLAEVCLSLLKTGVPAFILGDDVNALLVKYVDKIEKVTRQPCDQKSIQEYCQVHLDMMPDSWKKCRLTDIMEILLLLSKSQLSIEHGLKHALTLMFKEKSNGVVLSSVHRAKGKEAKNIFILEPEGMPCSYAESAEQVQQERNLIYVGVTRALENLYYVTEEVKEWRWNDAKDAN